jgi:hypothetical protein
MNHSPLRDGLFDGRLMQVRGANPLAVLSREPQGGQTLR